MEQTQSEAKRARPCPSSPPSQAAEAEEDRLSALDNATLHAILARLPLRDATATTVLSRRWPRVFATLPRLRVECGTFNRRGYLDDDHCEDSDRWLDALDCVLASCAAPVSAFDIRTKLLCEEARWFGDLFSEICGSGGLRELCIMNSSLIDCYKVPSPVYNCQTLTSLELYCCHLRVPGNLTGLRAVRSLHLGDVVATDADIRRMISRCQAMERLVLNDIRKAWNIVIRAPSLEMLKAPRLESVKLGIFYGSAHDSEDTDGDDLMSETYEIFNFGEMEEREHQQMDEIGNLLTFLGGVGRSKSKMLSLKLKRGYCKVTVLGKTKNSVPMMLPKKDYLLGLQKLTLTMDHNHETVATLDPYDMKVLERMSLKYRRWVYVQRDESEHKAMYDEFEQHEALLEAKRHELHEAMVETVQSYLRHSRCQMLMFVIQSKTSSATY
ncbi:putative F-box/LRR-repeat protein At5g41840 [Panicum hallii]|uniref:putative F-box/LRR-repeat protein At5g41840 n=1 Tax=Panicum hallii TaxID=206008 RepID=UPI000DF4F0BB|nr:putative F-box/LRR-repeat protein At5g41840 [Panicum hallii]